MKKQSPWLLPVLLGSIALCAAIVCAILIPQTQRLLQQKQSSLQQTNAFLASDSEDIFRNSTAIAQLQHIDTPTSDAPLATFTAPEGFVLKSHSKYWDSAMLEKLYQELLQNKHGDEITHLTEITVYAKEDEDALASHLQEDKLIPLTLRHPALPPIFQIKLQASTSSISLYGGDTNQTIESMARSLSHEYGHHFTFYHMFGGDGSDMPQSEYARLRGLGSQAKIDHSNTDDYLSNHHWYLAEIAAEDYVLLMGSPTTRQYFDFVDVKQSLAGKKSDDDPYVSINNAMNLSPQENLMIPLAYEVEGLEEYFYRFIGDSPPTHSPSQSIRLNIQKKSRSYHLITGYQTFVHYQITWNTPYPPGTLYTLVYYSETGEDGYYFAPVKTVRDGDEASAVVGTVTRDLGSSIRFADDGVDNGKKIFLVTAVLPDGTIYLSEPLPYEFN